jgi:predicted Zn-dependent peptidase
VEDLAADLFIGGDVMYRKEYLSNGIRLITEEIPYVRSVSLGVWFIVGSRQETCEQGGISHFIEHMLFKGTETRTAQEIAEAMDAVGGQLNAFTSREYTCYYAKVLDTHFPLAAEILADMLQNSLFTPEDVEKEKNVIMEEIKMYEDAPDELVHDLFTRAAWSGHSLGNTILGQQDNIRQFSRDTLTEYFAAHYTPNNCVIAVAGNISHPKVRSELERCFAGLKGKKALSQEETPVFRPGNILRPKQTEQVHLCIGTPGVSLLDKAVYSLHVISNIIGGGASSRLFQSIREEKGLAYSIYSYQSSFHDAGLFTIYAGMSPDCAAEVVRLTRREIARLRQRGISEAELVKTKEQLKGSLLLSLESTGNRMTRMAKSEIYFGRIIAPDELIAKIDAVTHNDVRELAQELLAPENMALAAVGPVDEDMIASMQEEWNGTGEEAAQH